MNKSTTMNEATQFIIKRAFRAGAVMRADVLCAFEVSTATATRIMANALTSRRDLLEKKQQKIVPKILAKTPAIASEEALMDTLNEGGRNFFRNVGLYEHELPVTYVSWLKPMPMKSGILKMLVEGIRTEGFVRIVYIGMRKKEEAAQRIIAPLGLERMNDQWRVIAQDMEKEGHPIRTFVFSRILAAEKTVFKRRPVGFVHQHYADPPIPMQVTLNPALTPLQQEVVANELGISAGKIQLTQRGAFEFKRRFAHEALSPDAVWPPLMTCDKL